MKHSAAAGLAISVTVFCGSTVALASPAATPLPVVAAGASAAEKFGWGTPNRDEEFSAPLGSAWGVYNGPGHNGQGRRTPTAVGVANGVMTISGDGAGNTAGMAWGPGQKYGRWEGRVRAPASDPSYHAVLLLWPDAENWPVGGEVDFMEMSDPGRQSTDMFLHYGASNSQISSTVTIDATQWHDWAVEWAPDHITAYVDGVQWFHTTNMSILPPGPMHLCIQLDWFPQGGTVRPSSMQVDWVRQYPYLAQPVATPTSTAAPTPTLAPTSTAAPIPTLPPVLPTPTVPVVPTTTVPVVPTPTTTTTVPVLPTTVPVVPPMPTTTPAAPPLSGSTPGSQVFDPMGGLAAWVRSMVDSYRARLMAALGMGGRR